MSAARLRAAADAIRTPALAAQGLNWEASKDLEYIGFSDSGVALAVADVLTHTADVWEASAAAGKHLAPGRARVILPLADAILGDAS